MRQQEMSNICKWSLREEGDNQVWDKFMSCQAGINFTRISFPA